MNWSRKAPNALVRDGRRRVPRPGRRCWQPAPAWRRRIAPARTQCHAKPAPGTWPGGGNGRGTRTSSKRKNSARPPSRARRPGARFEKSRSNPVHPQPAPYNARPRRTRPSRTTPSPGARRTRALAATGPAPGHAMQQNATQPCTTRPRRTTPVNRRPKPVRRRHPIPGHPGCHDPVHPRRVPTFAAAAHLAGRAIRESAQQPYTPSAHARLAGTGRRRSNASQSWSWQSLSRPRPGAEGGPLPGGGGKSRRPGRNAIQRLPPGNDPVVRTGRLAGAPVATLTTACPSEARPSTDLGR